MKNFRDLNVWSKSHKVALKVYGLTKSFPKEEIYSLTSQMRRSASSIPTNIAEGCGRGSDSQFGYFLNVALGSASELEYQIILSSDLKLISDENSKEILEELIEVKKMLTKLYKAVSRK
ncbi:MAG: four helix bundle protein [Balneola sp.]